MAVSRRAFVRALGVGSAGVVSGALVGARGREAWAAGTALPVTEAPAPVVRLDSNENPNGPGSRALEAIRAGFDAAPRYPHRTVKSLVETVARAAGVGAENVWLGCGSTEILHLAVLAFTSVDRGLVAAVPTFENPARTASRIGRPVVEVPVDAELRLDLDAMGRKAAGAGLLFVCNPNNPTGTVHGASAIADLVGRVIKASPDTIVLLDEAYHEYVDDPSYATALPLAMQHHQVIVSRTFSKVFGMAGLRVGYAIGHPETLERMSAWAFGQNVNVLAQRAAAAVVADKAHIEREQQLNRDARAFTCQAFESMGFAPGSPQTNFVFVDLKRDIDAFRGACLEHGIAVGRLFPPLTSYARVSIGTMDEMRRAVDVFRKVLGTSVTMAVAR
jgi:histidinol-phosphate aminotransferase